MRKVLNLWAGLGANRKLWQDVEVTAVEIQPDIAAEYQRQHPADKVIVGDAHEYLLNHADEFDFIWASPTCQSHSRMMKATRHNLKRYPDMRLYQEIIFLQNFYTGRWVVENVNPYYEPLIKPSAILGRHLFWSNFQIKPFTEKNIKNFINKGTVKESEELKQWLGINYEGNIYYQDHHCPAQVLRNCVHPELGEHIFNCAMNTNKVFVQKDLFNA